VDLAIARAPSLALQAVMALASQATWFVQLQSVTERIVDKEAWPRSGPTRINSKASRLQFLAQALNVSRFQANVPLDILAHLISDC